MIGGKKCKLCKGEKCEECTFTGFSVEPRPKMVPNDILRLVEDFTGSYDRWHYVERVYDTIMILENVLDKDLFTKYYNKTNRAEVENICA